MSPEYKTKTLAQVYESQGYFQDALEIYEALDQENGGNDKSLKEACERMEAALATPDPKERAAHLLEQWLKLLILEKRLGQFEKVRARLQ